MRETWSRLAVSAALVAAPLCALADFTDVDGKWNFTADGTNATITGWAGDSATTSLSIPETVSATFGEVVSNYVVRTIGEGAVSGRGLEKVFIPGSVEKICSFAFSKTIALSEFVFYGPMPEFGTAWFGEADPALAAIKVNLTEDSWTEVLAAGKYSETVFFDGVEYVYEFKVSCITQDDRYVVSANPPSGYYNQSQQVALGCGVDAPDGSDLRIYYTTDGTKPSLKSSVFSAPLEVSSNTTIMCIAVFFDTTRGGIVANGPVAVLEYSFPRPDGGPYSETSGGLEWSFRVKGGAAYITRASHETPAISVETRGAVSIPAMLGGRNVVGIDVSALERCRYITSVSFPSSITNVSSFAFKDCLRLASLEWKGDLPAVDLAAFDGCALSDTGVPESDPVVIPVAILPGGDGNVAVPESWLDAMSVLHGDDWRAEYESRFGSDFTNSLVKATGKVDAFGNELKVWQDYVAGTDPLDADDVLIAHITMEDDVPCVTWTPDRSSEQSPVRVYRVYGLKTLGAAVSPVDVTSMTPRMRKAAGYRFFYVTVTVEAE